MLSCHVVQRARRVAIVADVAEVGAALDALGTGNVVFATLVDDPASVGEIVDAFLGEIMLEAANADAVADANIPVIYNVNITETISAADTEDGTVVTPPSTVTWDSATVTAVTLSGGNLVATNTGTTSANQGAHVISTSGKTTGKYYFEITWSAITTGINLGIGIGTTASTYTNMGNGGTTGVELYRTNSVWSNGSSIATFSGGSYGAGQVVGVAVDLDNRRIWFRLAPSGNWNDNATYNPATNVGGLTIPAGTMVPFVTFGGTSGAINNVVTANFGASSFTGAVPSGFTSGWPL